MIYFANNRCENDNEMKIILLSKVENYMPAANYKRKEEDNAREGMITAERHKLRQHNRRYISVALRFLPHKRRYWRVLRRIATKCPPSE